MAESPSGSLHYYFNHPGGELKIKNSTSELAEGVDVRGDGGMVIAPPTIRVDGQYRWLNDLEIADPPPWLIELCVEQPRVMPEAQSDPETEIWKVAAAAMAIPNDDLGRDEWNRIGMAFYRASGGSDLGLEWFTYWSAKSNKHHPENQTPRKRWEHYHKYPPNRIGGGTLVYLASEADPDWIVKFDMEMKRRFDRSQPSDKSLEQTTAEEEPKQGSEQSTAEEEQSRGA